MGARLITSDSWQHSNAATFRAQALALGEAHAAPVQQPARTVSGPTIPTQPASKKKHALLQPGLLADPAAATRPLLQSAEQDPVASTVLSAILLHKARDS